MKLTFLGTRGNTDVRTPRHYMHSALLVHGPDGRLMIDCGLDWLGRLEAIAPDAIAVTHAHPDHAWGLRDGAPCPVYASADTWAILDAYPVERQTLAPRHAERLLGLEVEAFALDHSLRAPAVGYRIGAGGRVFFYAPDLVYIRERAAALSGAHLYIGDGATMVRSMVRRRGDALFGHTPMRTQLTWCEKEGVPRAVFTHCGTAIISGDEKEVAARLGALATERGVGAAIAHDGMELSL